MASIDNMKPDNVVDMGAYLCTNVADYGKDGVECNLYPKTHKHYEKEV